MIPTAASHIQHTFPSSYSFSPFWYSVGELSRHKCTDLQEYYYVHDVNKSKGPVLSSHALREMFFPQMRLRDTFLHTANVGSRNLLELSATSV